MAQIRFRQFRTLNHAEIVLAGALAFPKPFRGDERIMGLHGLTLTFTAPSATITFSDPNSQGLLISQIVKEFGIDSTNSLRGAVIDDVLYVVQATPSAAVALNVATSTAAAKFGFPTLPTTRSGTYYAAPSGSAPRFLSFQVGGLPGSIIVATEE